MRLLNSTSKLLLAGAVATTTFLGSSSMLLAETDIKSFGDQQIQMLRQDIRDKRRQIVAANLPLSTEESAKFWPVYDQYIAETIKINDARFARIKDYAANYANLTEKQAVDYITKLFSEDKALIDLRAKYLPNFEKVLPNKKAAMFLQIDRRIQMMIDIQRAGAIPLIDPK